MSGVARPPAFDAVVCRHLFHTAQKSPQVKISFLPLSADFRMHHKFLFLLSLGEGLGALAMISAHPLCASGFTTCCKQAAKSYMS